MTARPPGSARRTPRGRGLAGAVLLALGLAACGDEAPAPTARPALCEETPAQRASALGSTRGLSQCGPTADFTPVNSYVGPLAVALEREDAVAFIDGRCTGTLVAAAAGPVVLTAGHCVGLDDRALVVFNYEDAPDGEELVVEGTVFERAEEPDYALIRLDALPAAVTPVPLSATPTETLAVIQHPRGQKKVMAEGRLAAACDGLVYYADLDTLVSSSGAGVLNTHGSLVGVHTDGDCDAQGQGANYGWTAEAVVEASPYLQPEDLVTD